MQASLSPRSVAIVTYALCGFSNPASVGGLSLYMGISKAARIYFLVPYFIIGAACASGRHSQHAEVVRLQTQNGPYCHGGGVMARLEIFLIQLQTLSITMEASQSLKVEETCILLVKWIVYVPTNLSYAL